MIGIEVKPKGKRTYKRLSVTAKSAQAMINDAAQYCAQWCKDNGHDVVTCDWRVINRHTDSVLATKAMHCVKPLVTLH